MKGVKRRRAREGDKLDELRVYLGVAKTNSYACPRSESEEERSGKTPATVHGGRCYKSGVVNDKGLLQRVCWERRGIAGGKRKLHVDLPHGGT